MTLLTSALPAVSIATAQTGASKSANSMGMRTMQERAYNHRGEQYLLIKSPPASGKSRALMFTALDKLHEQGVRQAIIVVPERSIGGSFASEPLSRHGFAYDWVVEPQWNLCNSGDAESPKAAASKVKAVGEFLRSDARVLVCTHATFRFAVIELGTAAFDDRLIAVDEFHHVSADPENRLGSQLTQLIQRGSAHIVAMTGSYFRGDSVAVLSPEDEAKFTTVTYTYYEQLNGYEYLKSLELGYFFYKGQYTDDLGKVLDPALKTIVHIPNVNSRESLKDKQGEVEEIFHLLGEWMGRDEATGFDLVKHTEADGGKVLRIANLVDDSDPAMRSKILNALKDPIQRNNRDHVDMIIALGMAKEGFDWIWCEHALTIGYRSSLTEVIQIIGRATRDAPGKTVARFTNLIAEPEAEQGYVAEAINDTLKAIAASLMMEQVMQPKCDFTPAGSGAQEGFDYGPEGYQTGKTNVGVNPETGHLHVEINGLAMPKSPEAQRICQQDLIELAASFVQDKSTVERGLFDEDTIPEELTIAKMGKIIRDRYPELDAEDQEAVRQQAVAAINLIQVARQRALEELTKPQPALIPSNDPEQTGATGQVGGATNGSGNNQPSPNLSLLEGVRQFVNVRDLSIDLIESINPFGSAYNILSKTMDEKTLLAVHETLTGKKQRLTPDEARDYAIRAVDFKKQRGRMPSANSNDPWEQLLAEGVAAFARYQAQAKAEQRAKAPAMDEEP